MSFAVLSKSVLMQNFLSLVVIELGMELIEPDYTSNLKPFSLIASSGLLRVHPVVRGKTIYEPGSRLTSISHYLSYMKSFKSTNSTPSVVHLSTAKLTSI